MSNSLVRLTLRFGQIELPKNTIEVFIQRESWLTHVPGSSIVLITALDGRIHSQTDPHSLTLVQKPLRRISNAKKSLFNLLNGSSTTCPTVLSTHCCDTLDMDTTQNTAVPVKIHTECNQW